MKIIFEYLEKIKQAQGALAKKELVKELMLKDSNTEEFFRLMFTKTIYGVSARSFEKILQYDFVVSLKDYDDAGEMVQHNIYNGTHELSFEELKIFLNIFKELSGNIQLEELLKVLTSLPCVYSKWVTRIVLKDLRIGITSTGINDVFKSFNLPLMIRIEPMLCGKINEVKEYKGTFPCFCGIKYDGFRIEIKKEGNNITMTARSGDEVDFVPEIAEELMKYDFDFILDGEIMGNTFNDIQKRIGRKKENLEPVPGLHFRVFDALKIKDKNIMNAPQALRYVKIEETFKESELLKFEERIVVYNDEELELFYKKACDRKEEGIVIKNMDAPYEYNCRDYWTKLKPVVDCDLKIIDWEQGKGKYKNTLGKVIVIDKSGKVSGKVGGGFNDASRNEFYNLAQNDKLKGIIIEVKFNEITSNNNGTHSLRFARFLRIRTDKLEEDDLSGML